MSENTTALVGDESGISNAASGQTSSDGVAEGKESNQSNQALQRILAEKKREQSLRKELESRLSTLEQEKLEAEGKKDELIKALKVQVTDLGKKLNETKATFAERVVIDQIQLKAKEYGCLDTELLTKAIDLGSLEVSEETYSVNAQSLEAQLDSIRKSKPFLFKQSGPQIKDGTPSTPKSFSSSKDFSKMTTEEIKKYAMEQGIS